MALAQDPCRQWRKKAALVIVIPSLLCLTIIVLSLLHVLVTHTSAFRPTTIIRNRPRPSPTRQSFNSHLLQLSDDTDSTGKDFIIANQEDDPPSSTRQSSSLSQKIPPKKKNKKKTIWITCSSTKELVHAVQRLVQPGDTVAELGSQLRDVSTAICETIRGEEGGSAVLVDTVRKFPKEKDSGSDGSTDTISRTSAMRRAGDEDDFFPEFARFREIGRLEDWRRALFPSTISTASTPTNNREPTKTAKAANNNYNVFVIDVNAIVGNDLEWTTLSIIREFSALNDNNNDDDDDDGNQCRLVLVKSLSLNQWGSRIIHGQRWCRQQGASKKSAILSPAAAAAAAASGGSHAHPPGTTTGSNNCHVVATVGVQEYRETIPYTVRPGDAVLEIGCHLGTSTDLLQSAAAVVLADGRSDNNNHDENRGRGYAIGVDIGGKIIKGAKKRYPDIHFSVGDAFATAALLRTQRENLLQTGGKDDTTHTEQQQQLNQRIGFDVIYVDVGGLSGQDGVIESLSLISALANALEPRCIVIKSLCMRRLSSQLVPYWKQQKTLLE